jgi:hypothetical protein
VLGSGWYRARLEAKQKVDERLWARHVEYLAKFLRHPSYSGEAERLGIAARLEHAQAELARVRDAAYADRLAGMTGAEPAVTERRG